MTQRIAVGITVVNLVLLVLLLAQMRPATAQEVAPVLRGRGLEIVDEQGRLRASITNYSDVVVFRLHDRNGKPTVKLDTHEAGFNAGPKGSGLGLLGDSDDTQAFIGTEGPTSKVGLKNRNGERQEVKP